MRRIALRPSEASVVTVTGTNGKGSTSAMIEAVMRAAGWRTGLYASPHLMRYNERVRIAGQEATDEALVAAFDAVEDARTSDGPPVPLTYFEFGTLAALLLFAQSSPDVLVLEVGLGGRLDAVNAIDADVAIVTSVDVDHREFLGDTRDAIGREKAGIFRAGRVAICGDPDPPRSLLDEAARIAASIIAEVDPLPFVPATVTTGQAIAASSRASTVRTRSSPIAIAFGWSVSR